MCLGTCSSNELTGTTGIDSVASSSADGNPPIDRKPGDPTDPTDPGKETVPVGERRPAVIPGGSTAGARCTSENTKIATVDAKTCMIVGVAPGKTTIDVHGSDGTTHPIAVTVTPKNDASNGTGTGTGPGLDSPPGSGANDPPELSTSDGGNTINVPLSRIHVDAVIDHDSTLKVTATSVFWEHHLLGAPEKTTVSFYDANGNLINATPWTPKFAPGQGSNCPADAFGTNGLPYCKDGCDCVSDEVKLAVPSGLTGSITNVTRQGSGPGRDPSKRGGITAKNAGDIDVHLLDCGSDCGRGVGFTLPGLGEYEFDLQ